MKLKSLIVAAAVSAVSALTLLTGCNPDESVLIAAANTAGNLGLSAWFAIDDPDQQVKDVLKEVVSLTEEASSKIGEGDTFIDALTPVIQEVIAKHDELTPAQKNLINTGSSVILSTLDAFIASNEKVKGNAELVSKVVASFCKGCLTAIERSAGSAAAKSLKKAHTIINMQYDAKAKAFVAR